MRRKRLFVTVGFIYRCHGDQEHEVSGLTRALVTL